MALNQEAIWTWEHQSGRGPEVIRVGGCLKWAAELVSCSEIRPCKAEGGVTLTDGEQKRVGRGVLFLDGNIQKSRLNFNRNALFAVPQLGAGKSYIAFRWWLYPT